MNPEDTFFDLIRGWATERGLYKDGDAKTQYVKLGEEFGELGRAIIKGNLYDAQDAIGDMVVVLTNLAELVNEICDDCKGEGCIEMPNETKEGTKVIACPSCPGFITIEDCIDSAWNEIKDRKGSMQSGSFVKDDK